MFRKVQVFTIPAPSVLLSAFPHDGEWKIVVNMLGQVCVAVLKTNDAQYSLFIWSPHSLATTKLSKGSLNNDSNEEDAKTKMNFYQRNQFTIALSVRQWFWERVKAEYANEYTNRNTKNQSSSFLRQRTTCSFHLVILQRTTKICTNTYNARTQLLPVLLIITLVKISRCK